VGIELPAEWRSGMKLVLQSPSGIAVVIIGALAGTPKEDVFVLMA
jgi:hypothetical protein